MLQLILILGGVVALLLLVAGVIVSVGEERSLVEERLGRYLESEVESASTGGRSSPLTDWINTQTERFFVGGRGSPKS